jgi:hypothetical protein
MRLRAVALVTAFGLWGAGDVLAGEALADNQSAAPSGAPAPGQGAYYFVASDESVAPGECGPVPGGASVRETQRQIASAQENEHRWVDLLPFQGRLPGTVGVESFKDGDPIPVTFVISDSEVQCQAARQRYAEVRTAIDRSRAPGLRAAALPRGKGRLIFEMRCTHTSGRAQGEVRTDCVSRKMCRQLKIQSNDPHLPVSLALPCQTTELTAE